MKNKKKKKKTKKKKKIIFTSVAMNGTRSILNPAISPKIKIWTATIITDFIVKHYTCVANISMQSTL